jgi:integrase
MAAFSSTCSSSDVAGSHVPWAALAMEAWRKAPLTQYCLAFRNRLIKVEAASTKTHEARNVSMNQTLTATVKSPKMSSSDDPTASVFGYGQPTKIFVRAVYRAGIASFTLYDLRHTFANDLVMEGVDLTTIKGLMRHTHIAMALRCAHLASGHWRPAIATLDRFAEKVPAIFTTAAELPARHRS